MRIVPCLAALSAACCLACSAPPGRAAEPPPSPEDFARGEQLFDSICSHCHGPHMVNPGTVSFDLRKFPHDERDRFFNSVENGKKAMPPWKDVLHPDEVEAIWCYVRSGGKPPQ